MHFLSDDDMKELLPVEEAALATPVPIQVVSSEEYLSPPQTIDDLKCENYFKELYRNSDTKVALVSNAHAPELNSIAQQLKLLLCHSDVASRNLAKDAAEVSAADSADIVRREALSSISPTTAWRSPAGMPGQALLVPWPIREESRSVSLPIPTWSTPNVKALTDLTQEPH